MLDWLRSWFSRPQTTASRDAMRFVGRARWIVHLFDALGEENAQEYGFTSPPAGYEDVLVFAFRPAGDRSWWTYITAGMSLSPALDGLPPTELLAYATEEAPGLVDLLYQLAFRDPAAAPLQAGDRIRFEEPPPDLGIPLGQDLGVLETAEAAHVLAFPDVAARPEDQRYVLARPGEDATPIRLLRVVGLKDDDPERFRRHLPEIAHERAWKAY